MQDFEQLDYYGLLGVTPDAPPEAIKRAYREQISRYHPDRFVRGTPQEQEYARLRAQRINEAYSVLGDAKARFAHKHRQHSTTPTAVPTATPTAPRDHQAELYAQALQHRAAGRYLQAAAVLRQLQQINPFYRDAASLLAEVEVRTHSETTVVAARQPSNRRWMLAGGIGAAAAAGLISVALALRGQSNSTANPPPAPTAQSAALLPATATQSDAATPQATVAPTIAPSAVPTTRPTRLPTVPSATPSMVPSATPSMVPSATLAIVQENGTLRLSDNFNPGSGWATAAQQGWSVGYRSKGYRISADPGVGNIWSYRTAQGSSDYSLGVDLQVTGGSAGLLVRFVDRANYVTCLLTPQEGTFRIEQRGGGRFTVLAEGSSAAIAAGASATNRVVVRVEGTTLTLLINGVVVAEAETAELAASRLYGLVAAPGDGTSADALFTNLELRDVR